MQKKTTKRAAVSSSELVLPLLRIGEKMSNICFNLSQDSNQSEANRHSMKECYRQWDDARRQYEQRTTKR